MTEWPVIRIATTHSEAHVLASLLRSAGISTRVDPLSPLAHLQVQDLGSYRVMVHQTSWADADEILKSSTEDYRPLSPCPKCGAATRRNKRIITSYSVSWFIGVLVLFFQRNRYCPHCKSHMKANRIEPFTDEELGYDPEPTFKDQFRRFLAWTRSIGYETEDKPTGESNEP